MSGMIHFNHRSAMSHVFALVDGLLVMIAVFLGATIYPMGRYTLFLSEPYLVTKIMIVLIVVEIALYYHDLMEPRLLRERVRMSIQHLKALGVYALALVVIYFMFPIIAMSHKTLFVSLVLIFWFTFSWRILYPWVTSNGLLKERVLIVGTGDLAKKIYEEIEVNGQDAYKIVGFVDENGKKIGNKIRPNDHRGLQANLFHLQNLSN